MISISKLNLEENIKIENEDEFEETIEQFILSDNANSNNNYTYNNNTDYNETNNDNTDSNNDNNINPNENDEHNFEYLKKKIDDEIFFDCEEFIEEDIDNNLFLKRSIEFDNFIRDIKNENIYDEEYDNNFLEKEKKKEKEILREIKEIEKKMKKKENEKREAKKRRTVKSSEINIKNINKKLGETIYVYNGREYRAYHNNEGKIIFNGILYHDIKEWLKLCFLVNIGK